MSDSSLVIPRLCIELLLPIGNCDTKLELDAEVMLWAAAAAATAAAFDTEDGKIGLHGECELPDALDEANGTPDDEYKSWLNWK